MPINPGLILQSNGQAPQSTPFEEFAQLQALISGRQQIQQQRAQMTAEEQARQQAAQSKKLLSEAFASSRGPDGLLDRQAFLTKLPGEIAFGFEKEFADLDKKAGDLKTAALKSKDEHAAAELDFFGNLGNLIKASGYDETIFKIVKDEAARAGHDVSGVDQMLSRGVTIRQIADGLISASEKQRQLGVSETNASTSATQADTGKVNAQRLLEQERNEALGRESQPGMLNGESVMLWKNKRGQLFYGSGRPLTPKEADAFKPMPTTAVNAAQSSNQLTDMPANLRNALDRAILMAPQGRRSAIQNQAARLWAEGNEKELKEVIVQAAVEGENVDIKNQIRGRRATVASLEDTRDILNEMKAAGVSTDILSGTAEDIARKLGTSTNPKYVELANRLMGTMINYRRAATGAAFSDKEGSAYEKMFPNYRNTLPVNLALIDGLMREMATYDRVYWEDKLGKGGADLVGIVPRGTQAPSSPADPLGLGAAPKKKGSETPPTAPPSSVTDPLGLGPAKKKGGV